MRIVIGIDPAATRLAAVIASGTRKSPVLIRSIKSTIADRWEPSTAGAALEWSQDVLSIANGFGEPSVYIEAPLVGRGGFSSTAKQAFISGAIQAAFATEGVPVRLINVQSWKKELANGSKIPAGKPAIARLLGIEWPAALSDSCGDEDIIDAAGVTLGGLAIEARIDRVERDGGL